MPSNALEKWQGQRLVELDELEAAHNAVGGDGPGRRRALLRVNHAYAVLVSSAFQGFCRDLHSEAVDHLVGQLPNTTVGFLFQRSMTLARKLDFGNPNPGNLGADFGRIFVSGFWPAVLGTPPNATVRQRQAKLETLNEWRNAIAHQDWSRLGGTSALHISTVRDWRSATNQLARRFDRVVRDELQNITKKAPW